MRLLALEREAPGLSAADFQPHLDAEARRVWELQQAGIIRELYFRTDEHAAVLLLECADEHEAHEALATLPLVQAGLFTFDVIGLKPYDGFARLFSNEDSD